MDTSNISLSDIAALLNNNNGNGNMWGENGLIWLILIILVLGMGGGYGGRATAPASNPTPIVVQNPTPAPAPGPAPVTQSELNTAINNQSVQGALNGIASAVQQTNYETAQQFSNQNMFMQQQNNTNQLSVLEGFNNLTQQISGQTNQLSSKLDNLSFQIDKCCCDMKSTMMQQQIDNLNRDLNNAQNKIDNANQSQTILSNMGRFVPWSGSGEATTGVKTVTG